METTKKHVVVEDLGDVLGCDPNAPSLKKKTVKKKRVADSAEEQLQEQQQEKEVGSSVNELIPNEDQSIEQHNDNGEVVESGMRYLRSCVLWMHPMQTECCESMMRVDVHAKFLTCVSSICVYIYL